MKKTEKALWDACRAGFLGKDSVRRFGDIKDVDEKDEYIAHVIQHLLDRADCYHNEAMKKYRKAK